MPRISIKIDASLFNAVPDEDKSKIAAILEKTNLLEQGGKLESTGDSFVDAHAAIADAQGFFDGIGKDLCKIGCDTAAAAAGAACSGLSSGVAIAACVAAAAAARDLCRNEC